MQNQTELRWFWFNFGPNFFFQIKQIFFREYHAYWSLARGKKLGVAILVKKDVEQPCVTRLFPKGLFDFPLNSEVKHLRHFPAAGSFFLFLIDLGEIVGRPNFSLREEIMKLVFPLAF